MGAIELGCPYYVYNPSRSQYFALNNPADTNFVGYVTDITGLDDAGVRENAQVIVAGDGGYHGRFWQDRRPWTVSGVIWPTMPVLARDRAQELMEGIFGQAMKSDGYLEWTPADGIRRQLKFRKQQPVRMTRGQSNVEKLFQLAGVSADYRITAANQSAGNTSGGAPSGGNWTSNQLLVTNNGNADAAPRFTIFGPINGFTVAVYYPDGSDRRVVGNINIPGGGDYVVVDLSTTYPQVYDATGTSYYGYIDISTDWSIGIPPGVNNIIYLWENTPHASGGTANNGTHVQAVWQDSWL